MRNNKKIIASQFNPEKWATIFAIAGADKKMELGRRRDKRRYHCSIFKRCF
ncbi:MAG: hypothetical protein U9O87_01130 [Verrucomicrobiota bacterium]|nr:hypothetical protein [Verrucomicrobiota bacterium]